MCSVGFYAFYDERKLVFWCSISSLTNVVMQACYNNFSSSREFTLLTHKYHVIIGQRAVNSVREFFLLILILMMFYISVIM